MKRVTSDTKPRPRLVLHKQVIVNLRIDQLATVKGGVKKTSAISCDDTHCGPPNTTDEIIGGES
jgi:hypothetical protein